jgi:5'-methylthioadenosine phosphorylase
VIQGPRFSTKAESGWFSLQGWDIVNMTQYPEVYFARKAGIHYGTIALITDYDVGLKSSIQWIEKDISKIVKIFRNNVEKANKLLNEIVVNFPDDFNCGCGGNMVKPYYNK